MKLSSNTAFHRFRSHCPLLSTLHIAVKRAPESWDSHSTHTKTYCSGLHPCRKKIDRLCHLLDARRLCRKYSHQLACEGWQAYRRLQLLVFCVWIVLVNAHTKSQSATTYLNVKPTNIALDILSSRSAISSRARCLSCTSLYLAMSASLLKSSK